LCLSNEGEVFSFGSNLNGQLGINTKEEYSSIPKKVIFNEKIKIKKISSGMFHNLAVDENSFFIFFKFFKFF
jgi:alpha-tubulin suppressor-like RCC1 family protein